MDLLELLDFLEPPVSIGFDVQPEQALEHFYAKGLRKSFNYGDLSASEHASSFTIAKMADMDMLADVKSSLEKAMEAGTPFKQWANEIMPTLQAKGWLGTQANPAWRLETIFRTNMQSAYAVGEWQQIRAQEEVAPFLMYDAVDDFRVRPEHAALDGQIHPVGATFWKHYHPPNDYNCRCGVIQLSQEELEELGLAVSPPFKIDYYEWKNPRTGKIERVAKGTGPGFDFNPGEDRYQHLQKIAQQKAAAMSADAAKAAMEGLMKTHQMAARVAQVEAVAIRQASVLSNASKAAERAAAHQINKALDDKTPYLAKAIQQVKATPEAGNMTATEILQVAKEKAVKAEASAQLYHYKQALLKGNKPNAKQQAAFDALPEEAQQAVTDQIKTQLATIKAETTATAELQALTANPNSVAAKTLAKMDQSGKSKVQVLEELKASVAAQKAKQVGAQNLAGLKKSLLASKTPTPAQKAAFDALTPDEQAEFLAGVAKVKAKQLADAEAAKPKAEPTPPPQAAKVQDPNPLDTELDPDDLVQTGPQGGSNPGGEFTDTGTGVKWYVKYPDNVEALRNEALAANLYRLAGVEMPEVRLITFKGRPAIASRIIDGLKTSRQDLTRGRVPGMQDHFAIDAWLSNWDVVGPDFANTKLNALGRAVRIDPGGALRFRAQGGAKGAAFGDDVLDLDSLRNASTNPHAAAVFKHVTTADIEAGVRRILEIPEAKIREMVDQFGPLDANARAKLVKTLLARREYLAKKYPNARPQSPEPLPTVRVTDAEQRAIDASRANGVTLPTDSDMIEDHHVVVTTLKDAKGKPRTRVTLKLRPQAGKKLEASMPGDGPTAPVVADLSTIKTQASEFLKGVGALAKKGESVRDKDMLRAKNLLQEIAKFQERMGSNPATADAVLTAKALKDVDILQSRVLDWMRTAPLGKPAKAFEQFDLDGLPTNIMGLTPEAASGGLPWKKLGSFSYKVAKIERGHINETEKSNNLPGIEEVRDLTIDGARVRYVPYGRGNSVTSEGYLQIDLDGAGVEVTRKAFGVLNEMNIPTKRPSELDRLELYLERIAAIRTLRNAKLTSSLDTARKIKDQQQRTEAMLAALNEDAGLDMRTSPNWNPQGVTQAFGHGRTVMLRPDVSAKEMADFEKGYVLYHNPSDLGIGSYDVWGRVQRILEGGGQLASQLDRVRRGVSATGTSVSSDHRTGGAAYVFTRILDRKILNNRTSGIYWRARQVSRLDAFSYDSDVFGAVSRTTQEARRAKDIKALTQYARSTANETIFRDSLSLFDDLEKIVFSNRGEYDQALKWLRENGYATWPDGRALEDVLDFAGRR